MRPLKLHTKTTLLASSITLVVFFTALLLLSISVSNRMRQEQREIAELLANNLADHISDMPSPRDPETMARMATLLRSSRPGIVSIHIWERSGGVFVERAAAAGSAPATDIPEETREALRGGGIPSQTITVAPAGETGSLYRVFATTTQQDRISGAVEVVERLDSTSSIALRYALQASWIALLAVALTTVSIYLLFRWLIYRPLANLLSVISRAKAGDLEAQALPRPPDELGQLSLEFNRMLEQLRAMTKEREAQQDILRQRVREATEELQSRNVQLGETNLELSRMTGRLTELERLAVAGQTAAQFAHEVGTPLNLISGHVQLLRRQLYTDPRAAELRIQTIGTQIDRIERIVRQMLDRTRFDTDSFAQLDLNALLRRVFDATAPTLDAQHVRLVASLDAELPPVAGDTDRLQQVFINLINNAVDAMPDGGELYVTTSFVQSKNIRDDTRRVIVEIADTGCGMTPETRAHIFKPLYTTKDRGRGTGLGLVVVGQIISDHGGGIEVESEPGRGAVFRLWFPISLEPRDKSADDTMLEAQDPEN